MQKELYDKFLHQVLTEQFGEEKANFILNDKFPEEVGLDVPEDDDGELQEEILNFIINNPYASPEMLRGFADSINVPFEVVLKQLIYHYTQLVIVYDQELNAHAQAGDWLPDDIEMGDESDSEENNS